ncbi:common central domain of tyrosinase [Ancylostoma ceylanicum]|uniref:Common central domain of tyrosinase n=1 Tax=Ancylostoma ceylanicum TaxID=53326 RepID=A0A0D6MD13_9BILA|nr:common central domain of tyrosinase [Ancylostoma ceylanicum]
MDIACLCGFFGGTGGSNCVLANGRPLTKALRKEYRVLTDDERQRYHTAMWTIKSNGDYDTISRIHSQFSTSPGAHSGPAFLPWHREFIKRLEIALRRVDPTLALPYWDSTLDGTLPSPADSVLWGNELMGSQDSTANLAPTDYHLFLSLCDHLEDREFDYLQQLENFFPLLKLPGFLSKQNPLIHIHELPGKGSMSHPITNCPNPADWTALEYVHGGPHVFTGGDMLVTTTATNDPIFFNHHSMIDLIWEQWRLAQQSRSDRETAYPADDASCSSSNHFANNTMAPFFPMVNLDGLSNDYTDNLYEYAPRPTCTFSNPNGCGSKYLFCDFSHGSPRCVSKIMIGGNCGGYTNNEDRCYLGQCRNNICSVIPTPMPTTQPPIITTTPIAPAQENVQTVMQDAPAGRAVVNAVIIRRGCQRIAGRRVTSVDRRGRRFVVAYILKVRQLARKPGAPETGRSTLALREVFYLSGTIHWYFRSHNINNNYYNNGTSEQWLPVASVVAQLSAVHGILKVSQPVHDSRVVSEIFHLQRAVMVIQAASHGHPELMTIEEARIALNVQ